MAIVAAALSPNPGGNKTSETTFVVAIAGVADAIVGDLLFVGIAADNAGTSGVSSITGVTDSQGNVYALVKEQNRTSGSALDGCTASLYAAPITTQLTHLVDSVSITFSPATVAKAVSLLRVNGSATSSYGTDGASGSGATYSSNASATLAVGDIYVGVVANESNTAPAFDSDTTNGSWAGDQRVSGGSGGDATKMAVNLSRKITTTAAGTQTLDAATGASTDWALAAAWYTVPSAVASLVIPHRHRGLIVR